MEYFIVINGKSFPARYTLRVALAVADKFGSFKLMMQGGDNERQNIEDRIWLVHELIKDGKLWRETEIGGQSDEVPTEEQLMGMIDFADLGEINAQIFAVINKEQPSIVAEAPRKNADAAQVDK